LHEADKLERAALPAELAAGGLRVLLAEDNDVTVAVLLGRHRRELVVLRAGRLVRWETVRADEPELLCARLAVARIAGAEVDLRQVRMPLPPQPGQASLVLRRERDDVLHWALLDAKGTLIEGNHEPEPMRTGETLDPSGDPAATMGSAGGPSSRGTMPPEPPGADPDAVPSAAVLGWLLQEAGWGTVVIPDPAASGLADLLAELLNSAGGDAPEQAGDRAGATLAVRPQRREGLVWLDADGLHRSDFDGQATRRVDAPWSLQTIPLWAVEGWSPPPEPVFGCSLDGMEAVVVRAGGHAALGVRDRDGAPPRWGTLRDQPEELARLAAGVAFSPGQGPILLEVAELTDPEQVVGPELLGGQFRQRRISVVLRRLEAGPGADLTGEALGAFAADLATTLPGGQPLILSADLAAALLPGVDRVGSQVPRYQVGLGLLVEETWQLGGDAVPLVYELAPGEQRGRLRCQETGTPTATVLRDREGHLVAAALTCRYCQTASCGLCSAAAWPCGVCQIIVCGYCAQTPGDRAPRCPACRDLRPASWMERRHYSRVLAPRGRLLLGHDRLHQVALVESVEGWQLLLAEGDRQLPPTLIEADSVGVNLIEGIVAAS